MIATEKLEEILSKCRIILEFAPLPDSILGHYHCDGNYYVILINDSIRNDEALYRCVLAEEIGHYRTTIGDITPRKYMCYRDRLTVDKLELQALKWATDFLLPTYMLIDYIQSCRYINKSGLADYFRVTEPFLMQKFEFMARQKPSWELDDTRCLYLYNLPSVFVYEKLQ